MRSGEETVYFPIVVIPLEPQEKPNLGPQMARNFKNVTNVLGDFRVALFKGRTNLIVVTRTQLYATNSDGSISAVDTVGHWV